MKALKQSLNPGLCARRACQMKWELFLKADRGCGPCRGSFVYTSLQGNPMGGNSWALFMARAGAGAQAETAGKQILSQPQEGGHSSRQKACPVEEATLGWK